MHGFTDKSVSYENVGEFVLLLIRFVRFYVWTTQKREKKNGNFVFFLNTLNEYDVVIYGLIRRRYVCAPLFLLASVRHTALKSILMLTYFSNRIYS